MTLKEWIEKEDRSSTAGKGTTTWLVRQTGVARETIWRWANGETLPSRAYARLLSRITNREVSENEILGAWKPRPLRVRRRKAEQDELERRLREIT